MTPNVEAQVLVPIWHAGKPIVLAENEPKPVISLPRADAVYLQSIGRVRIIDAAADEASAPASAPEKRKAK